MNAVDALISMEDAYDLTVEIRAEQWARWCTELEQRKGRLTPLILGMTVEELEIVADMLHQGTLKKLEVLTDGIGDENSSDPYERGMAEGAKLVAGRLTAETSS